MTEERINEAAEDMSAKAAEAEEIAEAAENEAAATANEVTTDDLVAVNEGRAATYRFLARLFRTEVDQPLLDELFAGRYKVSTGNASMDEGHRLLATALSGIWDNTLTELAADYLRTFLGHGYSGHSAAYPYESVYASEKRLLMGDARDEVLALYRAAGLDKDDSWKEPEDHVALELEFMGVLAQRTAEALRDGQEDAAIALLRRSQGFLEDHLGQWAPLLADSMRNFAKTDFYQGLSYMLEGFVESDEELLADLLSDERA